MGITTGQTLKLTEAGKLALNKVSLKTVTTSNLSTPSAKVISSSGGTQLNRPIKIITLNSSKASNLRKIQSKPVVINAPYVIPQNNRTAATATKIQSEAGGDKKGTKIIRLTPEQFAAIKSGWSSVIL